MLNNLKAEMARSNVSPVAIASVIKRTDRNIRDKLCGKSQFDVSEAMTIRDRFFPGQSLEYLFADSNSANPSQFRDSGGTM